MSKEFKYLKKGNKLTAVVVIDNLYANNLPDEVVAWFNICNPEKRKEFAKEFVEMI